VKVEKLIKMANQIGAFFASEPEKVAALEGVAGHLSRFWEPRMRRELLQWVDEQDGRGLTPLVLEAIRAHRVRLTPSTDAPRVS
jgi:formate dehydrogenase subunit delta